MQSKQHFRAGWKVETVSPTSAPLIGSAVSIKCMFIEMHFLMTISSGVHNLLLMDIQHLYFKLIVYLMILII